MNQQRLRSANFLRSIGLDPRNKDALYLHALDVIGAVSFMTRASSKELLHNNSRDVDDTKRRTFWKTLQEISSQQLEDVDESSTTNKLLAAFPDNAKKSDGRMWLSLHFAVSVPSMDIDDIEFLLTEQPKPIFTFTPIKLTYSVNEISMAPCHLAVMTKTPNMALIKLLTVFDKNFASILAGNGSTPLHLAAEHSTSVALIQHLIQLNPQALEHYNDQNETPLICVAKNKSIDAPEILQVLIHAAPHTVGLLRNGKLPLHRFLKIGDDIVDTAIAIEHVIMLLEAFPDAVNIPDEDDHQPIHIAAENCSVDILKIITEANPEHLSTIIPTFGSVAHCTVTYGRIDNCCYIHSMMPELFHTLDEDCQNPLHLATEKFSWYARDQYDTLISLVPETARNVDIHGCNLLHTLASFANMFLPKYIVEDQLEELIRLFLRLIPGGALALNNQGQTPYDLLNKSSKRFILSRRLLLLAGAPSLHPETRQQMNYQARKGALFAFFAQRWEYRICSQRLDICYRIRHGAGAMEIMREVISFL